VTEADIRLSIVIATTGRPTLLDALASIAPQAREGDEVITILDAPMHGGWGHAAHNRGARAATGTHLIFIGDDDDFLPDGLARVRAALATAPDTVHIFPVYISADRIMGGDYNFTPPRPPADPMNFAGTIAPQGGIVVPRSIKPFPLWLPKNKADRQFAADAATTLRCKPIWHTEPIGRWAIHKHPGWTPRTAMPVYSAFDQMHTFYANDPVSGVSK